MSRGPRLDSPPGSANRSRVFLTVEFFHTPGVNQHRDQSGCLHAASLPKPFKMALVAARLPYVHPRTLRHTHAAFLVREGAHPKLIQTVMEHASITVTMDLGHLFPGLGAEPAERLRIARSVLLQEGKVFSATSGVPT